MQPKRYNELLRHENEGLKEALIVKKRHRKVSKPLNLQQREEYYGGAMFWLPQKVREACAQMLAKANRKELRLAAKLYKDEIAEEKRVAREEAKVRRASRPPLSAPKRQRRGGASAAAATSPEAASALLPKVNSRGRTINVPHKCR
ncbi:hypothetical protein CC86DRAFT_396655 [Ophiobolus disseminans]|uniref:Uncharacterized protein n=1 Tax=Ophiobolus disseminans TaxID=1469910 RepID=A0A6A6ZNG6_9PLEO|nr:hypothetical protein CC86DRAFT_396655 [Ophiobolus disseminans]